MFSTAYDSFGSGMNTRLLFKGDYPIIEDDVMYRLCFNFDYKLFLTHSVLRKRFCRYDRTKKEISNVFINILCLQIIEDPFHSHFLEISII